MSDIFDLTALELGAAIRQGEVSPTQAARAALDRMEETKENGAFVAITADRALERAREIEQQLAAGKYTGPLAGVPMALSAQGAAATPTAVRPSPAARASATEVCTVPPTLSASCAPYACAMTTVVPEASPTNRLTKKLMREPVAPPTAASACVPTNCPTMTASAVL